MPFYNYKCKVCSKCFEKFHGISEVVDKDCLECKAENSLYKTLPTKINVSSANTAGKIVDEYIKEMKQDLKEEQEKQKKVEYKK